METVIILFKGSPFLESRIKEENTDDLTDARSYNCDNTC